MLTNLLKKTEENETRKKRGVIMYKATFKYQSEQITVFFDQHCFATLSAQPQDAAGVEALIKKICASAAPDLIHIGSIFNILRVRKDPKHANGYILLRVDLAPSNQATQTVDEIEAMNEANNISVKINFACQNRFHVNTETLALSPDAITLTNVNYDNKLNEVRVRFKSSELSKEEILSYRHATYVLVKKSNNWGIFYYKKGALVGEILVSSIPELDQALAQLPSTIEVDGIQKEVNIEKDISLAQFAPVLEVIRNYHDSKNLVASNFPPHYQLATIQAGNEYLSEFHTAAEAELNLQNVGATEPVQATTYEDELNKLNDLSKVFGLKEEECLSSIRDEIANRKQLLERVNKTIDQGKDQINQLLKKIKPTSTSVHKKVEAYIYQKTTKAIDQLTKAERLIQRETEYLGYLNKLTIKQIVKSFSDEYAQHNGKLIYFKKLLATKIYEAGRVYFEQLKATQKTLQDTRKKFNQEFSCVFMNINDMADLNPPESMQEKFAGKSLHEIQLLIQQLLRNHHFDSWTSKNSSALVKLYTAFEEFDSACTQEFKLKDLSSPDKKLGFVWTDKAFHFEHAINRACERLATVIRGETFHVIGSDNLEITVGGLIERIKDEINNNEIANKTLEEAKLAATSSTTLFYQLTQLSSSNKSLIDLHTDLFTLQEEAEKHVNSASLIDEALKGYLSQPSKPISLSLKKMDNDVKRLAQQGLKLALEMNDIYQMKISTVNELDSSIPEEQLKRLNSHLQKINLLKIQLQAIQQATDFYQDLQKTSETNVLFDEKLSVIEEEIATLNKLAPEMKHIAHDNLLDALKTTQQQIVAAKEHISKLSQGIEFSEMVQSLGIEQEEKQANTTTTEATASVEAQPITSSQTMIAATPNSDIIKKPATSFRERASNWFFKQSTPVKPPTEEPAKVVINNAVTPIEIKATSSVKDKTHEIKNQEEASHLSATEGVFEFELNQADEAPAAVSTELSKKLDAEESVEITADSTQERGLKNTKNNKAKNKKHVPTRIIDFSPPKSEVKKPEIKPAASEPVAIQAEATSWAAMATSILSYASVTTLTGAVTGMVSSVFNSIKPTAPAPTPIEKTTEKPSVARVQKKTLEKALTGAGTNKAPKAFIKEQSITFDALQRTLLNNSKTLKAQEAIAMKNSEAVTTIVATSQMIRDHAKINVAIIEFFNTVCAISDPRKSIDASKVLGLIFANKDYCEKHVNMAVEKTKALLIAVATNEFISNEHINEIFKEIKTAKDKFAEIQNLFIEYKADIENKNFLALQNEISVSLCAVLEEITKTLGDNYDNKMIKDMLEAYKRYPDYKQNKGNAITLLSELKQIAEQHQKEAATVSTSLFGTFTKALTDVEKIREVRSFIASINITQDGVVAGEMMLQEATKLQTTYSLKSKSVKPSI